MPCTLLRKSYFKAVETDVQLKVTDVPATEDDKPIGTLHDTVGTKVVNEFIDVQEEVFVPAESQIPFTCH